MNKLHIDSLLTKLLDNCKLGILISDANGIILWGNQYYSQLAGFDIRAMTGQDIRVISRQKLVALPSDFLIDRVISEKKEITSIVKYKTVDFVITTATPVFGQDGAIEYLVYSITNYSEAVRMQNQLKHLSAKNQALEAQLNAVLAQSLLSKNIIVSDLRMKQLYKTAARLSSVDTSVLILGESGVGKDVYARFLHSASSRRDKNFIHVNLASIPKSLFESELFGYEPGAFTGALKNGKCGLIELANHGTLFLDEIGEMEPDIQAKLLQVIQEKSLRRVGSSKTIPLDIRIISATNCNLEELVRQGKFRLDLYYRLNVVSVEIPPLRERPVEIPLLADMFLKKYNELYHSDKVIENSAMNLLLAYDWPGNIRELNHLIERLVVVGSSRFITPDQLPDSFLRKLPPEVWPPSQLPGEVRDFDGYEGLNLKDATAAMEQSLIRRALALHHSTTEAAKAMGIDVSTLSKKRKKYGI